MAAPTSPYCTSQQVAYLLQALQPGQSPPGDFSSSTIPTDTQVDMFVDNVSSEVEMAFAQVGYKIPFQPWGGENWPEFQTQFLRALTIFGATAHTVISVTAPVTGQGRQSHTQTMLDQYDAKLRRIFEGAGVGFRADCYTNSAAYQKLTAVAFGPATDWGQGIVDAADFVSSQELTHLYSYVYDEMQKWAGGNIDEYSLDIPTGYGLR